MESLVPLKIYFLTVISVGGKLRQEKQILGKAKRKANTKSSMLSGLDLK